ncbi:MAG: SpoIIE family protein phosphatase [Clostridia bacterium]|nr:SpoIIE family protein phosphatase [Clostridia bacterium]
MVAGILNKLGRVGVIIGFCLGNALLTYFTNGNTLPIITIREILIASLGLLFIPKHIDINIEDIIGKSKYLPVAQNNRLNEGAEVTNKLNTVSETILEMAQSYNEVAATTIETDEEIETESKNIFKEDLINNIEDFTENLLYEDMMDDEDVILDSIYEFLEQEEEISKEDFLKIFEQNNNYIIGINSDDEETKEQINNDINQIVKAINHTYRINKLNLLWKKKEAMNKKTLATQLGGVSKVISSIADEIDEPKEEKEDNKINYKVQIGFSNSIKKGSTISGDNFIHETLHDGKYMLAISDGMGSGEKANKSSKTVINMLSRLLTTGFDKEVSIGLINSSVNLNSNSETYATLDISILDLKNGNAEFVKNGACPTFIKNGKQVEVVKSVSLPAGILDNIDLVVYDKDLHGGEFIIMCSDGILESNKELANKEIWIKELLENLETNEVQKIADIILQEALDNNVGIAKDDMTVLVAKIDKI